MSPFPGSSKSKYGPIFPGSTDGKVWVDKSGTQHLLVSMTDSHLNNSIAMVERGIKSRQGTLERLQAEKVRRLEEQLSALAKAVAKEHTGRVFLVEDES